MHLKVMIPAALLLMLTAFTQKQSIPECFIGFNKASGLKKAGEDRLPADARKPRIVKTAAGEVSVSCLDGYRVRYNNKKKGYFVNIKAELSDPASYAADTTNLVENLKYLQSVTPTIEPPIRLKYNGYSIYGISRNTLDNVNNLGTFVMFPGNNIVIYFYFNNLPPETRHFKTVEEYNGLRNEFIGEYTSHLKQCGTL